MEQEHRDWFDRIYGLYSTQPNRLPTKLKLFPYITRNWPISEVKKLGFEISEQDSELYENLRDSIPPREAFVEEKRGVLKELSKYLSPIFEDVTEATYIFGKTRGDIDLFIISKEWRQIPNSIKNKFPLVDWKTTDYFIVPTAEEVVRQLLRFEKEYAITESPNEVEYLSEKRIDDVKRTIKTAHRAFGEINLESGLSVITPENIRKLAIRPFASHYFYCENRSPEDLEPNSLAL